MQKVEGSNPFSRSNEKPRSGGAFPCLVGGHSVAVTFCLPASLAHSLLRLFCIREVTDGRIDPEQAWFWTRKWQERERAADKDLAAGRMTRFESDEDFLAALDERTKPLDAEP
jgi:hypothetical protein